MIEITEDPDLTIHSMSPGAFGRVSRVRHKNTGMVCVAKELKSPTPSAIRNLKKEIEFCGSLIHPK